MTNNEFGDIFGVGAFVYAFSFLINGPLVDKIGGKKGMLIGAIGSSVANVALGSSDLPHGHAPPAHKMLLPFSVIYGDQHVLPKLRGRLHHQSEGVLVPCPRAGRFCGDLRHAHFPWHLFRL
jgi:hypothetical protein